MDKLDFSSLERCLNALETAYSKLLQTPEKDVYHDIFRAACVKEFELVLEIVVKLLRRALREYVTSTRELGDMTFKDVLRLATKHNYLTLDQIDRWIQYRDYRNATAHEYGMNYANRAVKALPEFIGDANALLHLFQTR